MKQDQYLKRFKEILDEMLAITTKKNTDYAGGNDAFKNFTMVSALTENNITAEQGILVRMTDKIQRVSNLMQREALVLDEKITDTLTDLAVYSIILRIYLEEKNINPPINENFTSN